MAWYAATDARPNNWHARPLSLIKRSCNLVTLKIIKVSDIKVKFWPKSDQAYRCNVINTQCDHLWGVSTRGFIKILSLNIIFRKCYAGNVSVQNLYWLYCRWWPHMLSFLSFVCADFTGTEYSEVSVIAVNGDRDHPRKLRIREVAAPLKKCLKNVYRLPITLKGGICTPRLIGWCDHLLG